MATPNINAIVEAGELVHRMNELIQLFEDGEFVRAGVSFPLTPAQISTLKQAFASARTDCKNVLDSITAQAY